MSDMPNRSAARARSYLSVVARVFYETLASKTPLDNTLRSFFRANKKYGSKDRRFIYESLYALFRWYGWLKDELPESTKEEILEDEAFCLSLLKALAWDNTFEDHPVVEYLKESFSFSTAEKGDLHELIPTWAIQELGIEDNTSAENELLFNALQKRPPVWLRLQKDKGKSALRELTELEADPEVHQYLKKAVKLGGSRLNLTQFNGYKKGWFEIQDLASQCLGLLCGPSAGERWWDVCAGGGGKSLQLADLLQGRGQVLATDIRTFKLTEIRKRATRSSLHNIQTASLEDAREDNFDGVLIDAPCSCTGVWRRNPELRWLSSHEEVVSVAKTQRQILEESCGTVKVGGRLVYATCSMTRTENEAMVESFLEDHSEFEIEPVLHPLTQKMTSGMVRIDFLPDDCDAMFAAVMVRK
jgi:16S rRNA (cytosine967-C5)-methyltransferase